MNPDLTLEEILAGLPLFAPAGGVRRGRISSTALDPAGGGLLKAAVDFGSTPEGPDCGPDLEVATRRRPGAAAAPERELRAFCGERDLMERRARDAASAQSFAVPEEAAWSRRPLTVQGRERSCTVLITAQSWVGACALEDVLVRVFTPAPGPGPGALRRITAPEELEPLRGRG